MRYPISDAQLRAISEQMSKSCEQLDKWHSMVFQAVVVFTSIVTPLSLSAAKDAHKIVAACQACAVLFACLSVLFGLFATFVPVRSQRRMTNDAIQKLSENPIHPEPFGTKNTVFENVMGWLFIGMIVLSVVSLIAALVADVAIKFGLFAKVTC